MCVYPSGIEGLGIIKPPALAQRWLDAAGGRRRRYDDNYRDRGRNVLRLKIIVLKNAFDAFDHEKRGKISTDMIGTILEMLGHELDEDTLKGIVDEVDTDAFPREGAMLGWEVRGLRDRGEEEDMTRKGSGQLDFDEFCTLASKFLTEDDEDDEAMVRELREAFRLYDKEGECWFLLQRLKIKSSVQGCTQLFARGNGYITTDVLKEIFKELDNTLSAEDLDTMIEEIDQDGSGTVDFEVLLGISLQDLISNEDIRRRTKETDIGHNIKKSKRIRVGHVAQRIANRCRKKVCEEPSRARYRSIERTTCWAA
ncbi:Troponin C, isoform 1 [Eumeta japonica]|uniref:Troponin C, isoform 1 n=1 Tax=Eumeta variegata TaxID=151549 RepID=A0A4C1UGI8_EUMVA|nr:Troponin C, isoform 1 [Eumeta japonica]